MQKDGSKAFDRGNHTEVLRADGTRAKVVTPARTIDYHADGKTPRVKNERGTETHYNKDGNRTTEIKNGGRTVTKYDGKGGRDVFRDGKKVYSETKVTRGDGTRVTQRTITRNNNTTIVRNYRSYGYNGGSRPIILHTYTPFYTFGSPFYGFMYGGWAHPVAYGWGWGSWYPYYGYYFNPYPVYANPFYWMTDWLIADYLSAQHARRMANATVAANQAAAAANQAATNAQNATSQAMISEEIKAQIKEQVEQAVKEHERNDQAASSMDNVLQNKKRLFVLHEDMSVMLSSNGEAANLSEGDIVKVVSSPNDDGLIEMAVVTSKRGADGKILPAGTRFSISVNDLQEMENEFRGRIEEGMKELEKNKDKIGK